MSDIDKRTLTERDICSKFINPALEAAGWEMLRQIAASIFALLSHANFGQSVGAAT